MGRIEGKSVVVIGGTHGMGLATAKALVELRARVLLTGHSVGNIKQVQEELGDKLVAIRSDVSDRLDADVLTKTVEREFGAIDALFVFAAVAEFEPFEQVSEESYDRQFAVNAKGVFFAVQRLAPLVKDGGSITLTTVTPATASPGMGVYMGTKAAVRAFAQVFAAELLGRGIRVNTLAPGFVDTPTLGLASLDQEAREEFRTIGDQVTPMKRHGTVSEVARAALFLGFDATFSTGIELAVDGGLSTVDNP